MTSNINIISANITISDDLTIFVMPLLGLALNILVMLWT